MLFGPIIDRVEVRQSGDGSTRLVGRFPYGEPTELAPRGPMGGARMEMFAARAFARRIDQVGAEIHLLAGHDFNRPLASRSSGTLLLAEVDTGLEVEARITPAISKTTHGSDTLALINEGLSIGLSPGFRVADPDREERIMQRDDGSILRTILQADLFEISIVTMPAYPRAQVEARCWTPSPERPRKRMLL